MASSGYSIRQIQYVQKAIDCMKTIDVWEVVEGRRINRSSFMDMMYADAAKYSIFWNRNQFDELWEALAQPAIMLPVRAKALARRLRRAQ